MMKSMNAQRAMQKLGKDVAIARRRRGFSQQRLADGASIGVATVRRLEAGDPGVSIGNLLMILVALGETNRLADMLDIAKDDIGLLMETNRLPQRIRTRRQMVEDGESSDDGVNGTFDGADL
jgi:transcriptional regulator with XRE-family HTH domain